MNLRILLNKENTCVLFGMIFIGLGFMSAIAIALDAMISHSVTKYIETGLSLSIFGFAGAMLIKIGMRFMRVRSMLKRLDYDRFLNAISRYKDWELICFDKHLPEEKDGTLRPFLFSELSKRELITSREKNNLKIEYVFECEPSGMHILSRSGTDGIYLTNSFIYISKNNVFGEETVLKLSEIYQIKETMFSRQIHFDTLMIKCDSRLFPLKVNLKSQVADALITLLGSISETDKTVDMD